MHAEVMSFLDQVRRHHPDLFNADRVIEFGSYNINGSVRQLFRPDAVYTGVDWRTGPGVDVVSLAHSYSPVEGLPPTELCISTEMLEHDPYWKDSVANMVQLLAVGGSVLLTCAAPGRPTHEVDCAPENAYYRPVGAVELVQHLRELSEWDMLWAEQLTNPADTHVAAIGKKADLHRPATSVVMPVVNNADLTAKAVQSLRETAHQALEIIVIDNGSRPDQSEQILRECKPNVYLCFDRILGYPAATNRGIQVAAGQRVALCNNDIEMLTDGWDVRLNEALSNKADMVSPVFDYVGNIDQLDREGRTLHVSEARVLFFVMVYCHRSLFVKVGLLDERFGLGNSEDTDMSVRIVQAGGRLWVAPSVKVHHKGHRTFEQLLSRDGFQSLIASNQEKLVAKWQ